MTNRKKQIEEFLNKIYNSAKSINNDINGNFVYEKLVFNGIPEKNMCNQDMYFENWINHYRNANNTKCFVDPNWSYFCQFVNRNRYPNKEYGNDPIKIYISLDKDHINIGAKLIFDFLESENICHTSKIGSETRVDNIVLRIYNKSDAEKTINFINSNKYLVEGHNQVSPLNFTCGIVGLAVDNYNSYNSVLSKFIADYINQIKKRFLPRKPSIEDFSKFIKSIEIDDKFMKEKLNLGSYKSIDKIYIKEIKDLVLKCLTSDDLRLFTEHYDNVVGNAPTKKINKLSGNDQIIYDAIKLAITATTQKYSKDQAIAAITWYLKEGNPNAITRQSLTGKPVREVINKIDYDIARKFALSYTYTNDINEAVEKIYEEITDKSKTRH